MSVRRSDMLLGAGLWCAMAVNLALSAGRHGSWAANVLVAAGICLPVAWRRSAPVAALVVIACFGVAQAVWLTHPQDLVVTFAALAIAAYSVARNCAWPRALLGLAVLIVLIVSVSVATGEKTVADQIFPVGLFGGWWVLGRIMRSRAKLTAELRARGEQLERERGERERDAVASERARIARELHDVVAHSVSVMVIQAGAARRVLDRDPDASAGALATVESTGREALTEMRRLLGILRPDGEDAAHAPQPSLELLDALVERSRDAGLDVELRTEGEPGPLAPGVDLTAFRLVQEGLTNALKYGGSGPARVTLRWSDALLEIEVANRDGGDGVVGDALLGSGQGLVGMRERVALCGGELRAGPVGRGFVVRARLPRERALSPPAPAAA